MPDDVKAPEFIPFQVSGIKGLYIPFVGGFLRIIPNTPEAIASAQYSLRQAQASWLN